MKYLLPLLLSGFSGFLIFGQTPAPLPYDTAASVVAPGPPTTTIDYEAVEIDFGKVREGKIVEKTFWFRNTGAESLLIENVRSSCGCTVPEWPKEPVPPGGRGKIVVRFDTKGKYGEQRKRVIVTANTNPRETFLELSGKVKPRR